MLELLTCQIRSFFCLSAPWGLEALKCNLRFTKKICFPSLRAPRLEIFGFLLFGTWRHFGATGLLFWGPCSTLEHGAKVLKCCKVQNKTICLSLNTNCFQINPVENYCASLTASKSSQSTTSVKMIANTSAKTRWLFDQNLVTSFKKAAKTRQPY